MKNKKSQFERFLNQEIVIEVEDIDEHKALMKLCKDHGVIPFGNFNEEYLAYTSVDRSHLLRNAIYSVPFIDLPVEKFSDNKKEGDTQLIKRILANENATIIFFSDDTKQVVKHTDDLPYDLEKAVAIGCAKKLLGSYTEFEKVLGLVEKVSEKQKCDTDYFVAELLAGHTIKFYHKDDKSNNRNITYYAEITNEEVEVSWFVNAHKNEIETTTYSIRNSIANIKDETWIGIN